MIDFKKAIHLVDGPSALGVLRAYFEEYYPGDEIEVHSFFDYIKIGPLSDFTTQVDIDARKAYWKSLKEVAKKKVEGYKYEEVDYYGDNFQSLALEDQSKIFFKEETPLVIWHGSDAGERTLLYRYCHLLKDRDLYEINLDKWPMTPLDADAYITNCLATRNPSKDFHGVLGVLNKIDIKTKTAYAVLWENLKNDQKTLRIWENGKVVSVEDNYFDKAILENCTDKYQIASSVIGMTMGQQKTSIGDYFLCFRVYCLIHQKKIQARGNLGAMRLFEIKNRKEN